MLVDRPKHILVPVDGSKTASYAVSYAAFLQKAFGSRITLVHACGSHVSDMEKYKKALGDLSEACLKQGNNLLAGEKERNFDADVEVNNHLVEGKIKDSLIQFIRESDCDLVVIGSQGIGTPLRRFFVGSVAKEIVSNVEIPVLVLRDPKITEVDV